MPPTLSRIVALIPPPPPPTNPALISRHIQPRPRRPSSRPVPRIPSLHSTIERPQRQHAARRNRAETAADRDRTRVTSGVVAGFASVATCGGSGAGAGAAGAAGTAAAAGGGRFATPAADTAIAIDPRVVRIGCRIALAHLHRRPELILTRLRRTVFTRRWRVGVGFANQDLAGQRERGEVGGDVSRGQK